MRRVSLPSCLLTSEGSDVITERAGALIEFLWNFMLPVIQSGSNAQLQVQQKWEFYCLCAGGLPVSPTSGMRQPWLQGLAFCLQPQRRMSHAHVSNPANVSERIIVQGCIAFAPLKVNSNCNRCNKRCNTHKQQRIAWRKKCCFVTYLPACVSVWNNCPYPEIKELKWGKLKMYYMKCGLKQPERYSICICQKGFGVRQGFRGMWGISFQTHVFSVSASA